MNRIRNNKNGKPPRKRSHDVGRCRACGRRDELIAHGMCSECLETGRRPTAAVGMEKVVETPRRMSRKFDGEQFMQDFLVELEKD